jgi:predicted porin
MKKSLIALAVAGALTAPMVAQADATLYGKVEALLKLTEKDDASITMDDVIFGLKGSSETSVEGLTAIYKIEVELNENSGTSDSSTIDTRYAYAGATGAFGTVVAGRVANPTDVVEGYFDISNKAGTFAYNPDRMGSTIAYLSPSFSGFDFYATVMMNGDLDKSEDADLYSLGANYMAGPLSLSIGYWDVNAEGGVASNRDVNIENNLLVGGSYAFGPLTLGLGYETADVVDSGDTVETYGISAAYAAGAATPYIQYNENTLDDQADYDEWALGLNYALGNKAGVGVEYVSTDEGDETIDSFNVSYTVKF